MLVRLVVADHLHALDVRDLVAQRRSLRGRDVRDHHLRRAVGDKLVIHDGKRFLGLGVLGQVGREVALDLDPVAGKRREDQQDDDDQENKIPFVNNESGQLHQKRRSGARCFLRRVTHRYTRSSFPFKLHMARGHVLRQQRTIRQAASARDFSSRQGLKSAGILYVPARGMPHP